MWMRPVAPPSMATKAPKCVMPETIPSTSDPTMGPPVPLLAGWTGSTGRSSSAAATVSVIPILLSAAAVGASPMPEITHPPPELVPWIRIGHDFHHRLRGGRGGLGPAHQIHLFVALRVPVQPCLFFRARPRPHHLDVPLVGGVLRRQRRVVLTEAVRLPLQPLAHESLLGKGAGHPDPHSGQRYEQHQLPSRRCAPINFSGGCRGPAATHANCEDKTSPPRRAV